MPQGELKHTHINIQTNMPHHNQICSSPYVLVSLGYIQNPQCSKHSVLMLTCHVQGIEWWHVRPSSTIKDCHVYIMFPPTIDLVWKRIKPAQNKPRCIRTGCLYATCRADAVPVWAFVNNSKTADTKSMSTRIRVLESFHLFLQQNISSLHLF